MHRFRRSLLPGAGVALAATLALTGTASAAAPTVSTQGAARVTASSATLTARVNPQGQGTTYSFQYGASKTYGTTTASAPAGSGRTAVTAAADVTGLQADTTYHYRVVASNPAGVVAGGDRTFKTRKVPLSLVLGAAANPIAFGQVASLTGQLAGTGGGGRPVQLQLKPFPYTGSFVNYGNPVVTNPDGTFAVAVPGLQTNAQFRVVTTSGASLSSPPVLVGVSPTVRTAVSSRRPRARTRVRFVGTVTPAWVPAQIAIQKLNRTGGWSNVAGTVTEAGAGGRAKYAINVRISHSGSYRVFVGLKDSLYAPAVGPTIRIRVRATR